jgi:hypothetical protein
MGRGNIQKSRGTSDVVLKPLQASARVKMSTCSEFIEKTSVRRKSSGPEIVSDFLLMGMALYRVVGMWWWWGVRHPALVIRCECFGGNSSSGSLYSGGLLPSGR